MRLYDRLLTVLLCGLLDLGLFPVSSSASGNVYMFLEGNYALPDADLGLRWFGSHPGY